MKYFSAATACVFYRDAKYLFTGIQSCLLLHFLHRCYFFFYLKEFNGSSFINECYKNFLKFIVADTRKMPKTVFQYASFRMQNFSVFVFLIAPPKPESVHNLTRILL